MKRTIAGVLVAVAFSIIPASALAQTAGGKKSDDCKEQRRRTGKCELVIDDEVVKGHVVQPDDGIITVVTGTQHPSLIRYRQSMVDKMLKSAEAF